MMLICSQEGSLKNKRVVVEMPELPQETMKEGSQDPERQVCKSEETPSCESVLQKGPGTALFPSLRRICRCRAQGSWPL